MVVVGGCCREASLLFLFHYFNCFQTVWPWWCRSPYSAHMLKPHLTFLGAQALNLSSTFAVTSPWSGWYTALRDMLKWKKRRGEEGSFEGFSQRQPVWVSQCERAFCLLLCFFSPFLCKSLQCPLICSGYCVLLCTVYIKRGFGCAIRIKSCVLSYMWGKLLLWEQNTYLFQYLLVCHFKTNKNDCSLMFENIFSFLNIIKLYLCLCLSIFMTKSSALLCVHLTSARNV